jgi:hypothetical protein
MLTEAATSKFARAGKDPKASTPSSPIAMNFIESSLVNSRQIKGKARAKRRFGVNALICSQIH